MSKFTVIIPLHEFNESVETLLKRAIDSVPSGYEVRLSCKNGLSEQLKNLDVPSNVVIYESSDAESPSDFCSLVNQAVDGSEWFSVLEYDDMYEGNWFDNVEKWMEYHPETSMFVPLVDIMDFNDGKFIGYGNEAPWASSFSDEIGYIDFESIKEFFNFYLCGSVINTKDWETYGALKPSIKLTFWYEFLLRYTSNKKKICVIPKVGYKHFVNREGSLMDEYDKNMSDDEAKFWFEKAKEDYVWKNERDKSKYIYNKGA